MNKKEQEKFRKILLETKQKVVGEIRNLENNNLKKSQRESSGELSGYTFHMADVASDNYDREFSLNLVSAERDIAYEIDDALRRIDEGTFGICEACKKKIAKQRLEAMPYARLCITCQSKREKKA